METYLTLKENFVPPRDRLELQLVQTWQDFFHACPIGVQDNLFDLAGNSFLVNCFIDRVQQQFASSLSLMPLPQNLTIEQLAQMLRQPLDPLMNESLVVLQPKGSKPPFFLIPGGDGNIFNFYSLAHHLGDEQPVYGFLARGLDGYQVPHNRVEAIASDYLQMLRTIQPEGPYLLGGHCIGGFVAFEMATQLQKQGQEVALLVILDALEPTLFTQQVIDNDWKGDEKLLTFLMYGFNLWFNKKMPIRDPDLQCLELDEQLNYVTEQAQMFNIFPPDSKPDRLYRILQVFKTMSQVNYLPQTTYWGRMAVFRAKAFQSCESPSMGWERWASKSIETYDASGNHITMLTEPYVCSLAQQLRVCFEVSMAAFAAR